MLQKITKNLPLNIPAILLCLSAVLIFSFFIKADPGAKIQFTADTIVSLSGISDGDLYIAQNSECDFLSVSGSTLTVGDIPADSDFILKTSSHNNALKITPSGGVLDLTFESGNLSSGDITQWTLEGSTGTTVTYIVGTSQANTWYAVKADSVLFNSFQSNTSGEVSFTYDGGFSSKVFTVEQDTTAPTEFSLVSPVNNATTSNFKPIFSWNASTDPDLSYYQLYIDSSLDTNNITDTSTIPSNSLSCSAHIWYIKAVDNAGNSTNSSAFNLTMACGSSLPPSVSNPPTLPESTPENPNGEFSVLINNGDEYTNSKTITLKLNAGSDTVRMAISNTSDFKNASQVLYQEIINWDLDKNIQYPISNICTVYAKFYTQYGVASEVVSDSIILKAIETETEKQGVADTTIIVDGDIIQCVSSSNPFAVYIVKVVGDTKYIRHIVSLEIFNYYEHLKWENLKQVDSLNNYSLSGWVRYNTGLNNAPSPTDKVYEINGDQSKHWINMTAEDFLSHGGSEPAIFGINQGELNLYVTGADVMSL